MMNFLLGTIAGGLIACIATIAAARHPEVQSRLGLVNPSPPMTMSAVPSRPACPCSNANPKAADPTVGHADMLFSRRRFWFVAPN